MNLKHIKALDKKVKNEAKKAVNAIYKKYDKQMNELIAQAIDKDKTCHMFNGMAILVDNKTDKEITSGRAWGRASEGENRTLNDLSALQYSNEFHGCFYIKDKIKGKKRNI